jgi:hypothetical protein
MTLTGKFIMKVYVVTSGNYSDYGILAIFSTRGKARGFIKREQRNALYEHYIGDDYRIETWEVDKPLEPKIPIFFCYYYPENDSWKVIEHNDAYLHDFNRVHKEPDYGETDGYVYWVVKKARDKDSALKVANEQIMQFIAKEPPETDRKGTTIWNFRIGGLKIGPLQSNFLNSSGVRPAS